MTRIYRDNKHLRLLATSFACLALSGCGLGVTSTTGPSISKIDRAGNTQADSRITVLDLSPDVVARELRGQRAQSFAEQLGEARAVGTVVNPGDRIDITIWEAPPATLFGNTTLTPSENQQGGGSVEVGSNTTLPGLLVDLSGNIFVPFAGTIPVAGKQIPEIEQLITSRLRAKAHLPQVIVRLSNNATSYVTVVGEVAHSRRMPLTPKGERLLDALAEAGGTTQSVAQMSLQITRDDRVVSMPLDSVVRDPRQNVTLKNGDIITAVFQPYSFTALGAAGRNEEIKFESVGLTLAQALGRLGGLQYNRATAKGVFIFRWEQPTTLGLTADQAAAAQPVPVIYKVDLRNPATFFLAQQFPVRSKDIIYVADAPVAELQQFLNIVSSSILPVAAVRNIIQ